MTLRKPPVSEDGFTTIFRRWRRDPRTGRMLDAHRYGLAAWPIRIRVSPDQLKLF